MKEIETILMIEDQQHLSTPPLVLGNDDLYDNENEGFCTYLQIFFISLSPLKYIFLLDY